MTIYAVVGGTLWGNRGAEAMVATTIGRIRDRDPDAQFLLLSYLPAEDRALLTDQGVEVIGATPAKVVGHWVFAVLCRLTRLVGLRWPDALLPRPVRLLRGCRALFDVSGVSFIDSRLSVVPYNLLCVWPAMLLDVPVVRLSQATGPFQVAINRLAARFVTRRAFHTFARGRATARHIRELGVPPAAWSEAADLAFAYKADYSLTAENDGLVKELVSRLDDIRQAGAMIVGVVPSSVVLKKLESEGSDYLGLLGTIIADLQQQGLHVAVIPNATRAGADGLRNNDIAVIARLQERLSTDPSIDAEAISWVQFDLNTASIRKLIERCTVVVTSRFHAMVAALALGIPPLVLGWSHKYTEVLEAFGHEEFAVDFADAEERLKPLLAKLLADVDEPRDRIRAALPIVIASAESQFDVLDRL